MRDFTARSDIDNLRREVSRQIPVRFAQTGNRGGSDGSRIHFKISEDWENEIFCQYGTAWATVTHVSYGATYPAVGDRVLLCDLDGCYLTGPELLLASRTGFAERFVGGPLCTPPPYEEAVTEMWCIYSMCSAEYKCL